MKNTTCAVHWGQSHHLDLLYLQTVSVCRSSQSHRSVFGRRAPGCNRRQSKVWGKSSRLRQKRVLVPAALTWGWCCWAGTAWCDAGSESTADWRSPQTSGSAAFLEDLKKTRTQSNVENSLAEHKEQCSRDPNKWMRMTRSYLKPFLKMACGLEQRNISGKLRTWCVVGLPVCAFSLISALSSLMLVSLMTRLFGVAAAVRSSSSSSCCLSFLSRFLAQKNHTETLLSLSVSNDSCQLTMNTLTSCESF